ncbi:MAG: TIGR01906 family membrane protein [Peptococcaceae bacterium]|nr:TIGR01906 family membrane protein [Peptococcaceae bacterium]
MRTFKILSGVLLAIAVFLFFLTAALHWVTFDLPFYELHLSALGVADDLQVDLPTLMGYVEALTEYLKGARPSPNVSTVVRGQESLLYGVREIHHLEDVRHLFALSALIRNLSLLIVVVLLVFVVCRGVWPRVIKVYAYASAGVVLLLVALAVMATINFNRVFTLFHLVSFSNDLWLLDPATENLIVMFPEPFFAAAASRIAVIAFLGYILTLAGSFYMAFRLGGDSY